MAVDTASMFARVIQEHLELKRRNSALEHEMPLGKYMHEDPFENHPLFKTEEQARIEDTIDGLPGIESHETSLDWPTTDDTFIEQPQVTPSSRPRRTRPSTPKSAPTKISGHAPETSTGATRATRTWFARTRFASLRLAEPGPEVVEHLLDGPERRRAAEVERAGGEHLRAADRLVVRHLRRDARPEEVGDLGQHQRARG